VDVYGNRHPDLFSGSYMGESIGMTPGYIYVWLGQGQGRFTEREIVRNGAGDPVQFSPASESRAFATEPHLVDWDSDGDLDLLIGNMTGDVGLFVNEGNRRQPAFAVEPVILVTGGQSPLVPTDMASPEAVDWNGDGRLDLVVGFEDGSVLFFGRAGEDGEVSLLAAEVLLPAPSGDYQVIPAGAVPWRGSHARIHVTDFDGDGTLDLLVGDRLSLMTGRADLTEAEQQEFAHQAIAVRRAYRRIRELSRQRGELIESGSSRGEAMNRLMREYTAAIREFEEAKNAVGPLCTGTNSMTATGFVWVYIRR